MTSPPLSLARATAQQARVDLHALETKFARWRKKLTAPLDEAAGKKLDRWIVQLGDARHRETSSIRELKDVESKICVDR